MALKNETGQVFQKFDPELDTAVRIGDLITPEAMEQWMAAVLERERSEALTQNSTVKPEQSFRKRQKPLTPEEAADELLKIGFPKMYTRGEWPEVENYELYQSAIKNEFWVGKQERGIFLSGAVGTGKTTLAALTARHFAMYFIVTQKFLPAGVLFDLFFQKDQAKIEELKNVNILYLDDLGKEYDSDFSLTRFNNLIEYRYANLKPTFITSNLSVLDLKDRPGYSQIADRINDKFWMQHWTIYGKSKRLR